MKMMLVCSTCGFVAFVDRRRELEQAGWRFDAGPRDNTGCCPACAMDGAADELPEPAAAVADRRVH